MTEPDDCQKCRDWKKCPLTQKEKQSFNYQDIQWCPEQTFWLLKYADILHIGQWPVSDAIALGGMRGKAVTEATFAKVSRIIAEVDYRLARTGWPGRLLAEQAINREDMFHLDDDANDALYYVAGWNRKETPFTVWVAMKRYRKYNKMPLDKHNNIVIPY